MTILPDKFKSLVSLRLQIAFIGIKPPSSYSIDRNYLDWFNEISRFLLFGIKINETL